MLHTSIAVLSIFTAALLLPFTHPGSQPDGASCAGCAASVPPVLKNTLNDPAPVEVNILVNVFSFSGSCPQDCADPVGCESSWDIDVQVIGARTHNKSARVVTNLSGVAARLNGSPVVTKDVVGDRFSTETSGAGLLPCGEGAGIQITVYETDADGEQTQAWKSAGVTISCTNCQPS